MSIDRRALLEILKGADHPLGTRELLKQAGLHPGQQTDLKRTLRELVRDGAVDKMGKRFVLAGGPPPREEQKRDHARGRVGVPPAKQSPRGEPKRREGRGARVPGAPRAPRVAEPRTQRDRAQFLDSLRALDDVLEGLLHVHRDGFGFVHPLHDKNAENIFLPPDEASKALDGDRVLVQVVAGRGGRTAGVLLEVVERVRSRAVGVYRQEARRAWVEPSDTSLRGVIQVPPTQLARPGDLVKVVLGIGAAVLEPGVQLFGEVVGSIGKPGGTSGEVLSIAYSQGFNDEFPDEVMAEADHYRIEVTPDEAHDEGRHDLRTLPLLTIDGEDARDFDDAVYCEPNGRGWRLVVAIADVSHYVRESRPLDVEALHRGTSVYLPDRVLPMLPERLSNGICSLRPEEDRLCMVADMQFDSAAKLQSSELYPAVMRSVARCTYNEVQDVLDGREVPHRNVFRPHFENLMALARALNKMRRERGAIDFDLPEYKVILDDEGMPKELEKRERKDSHRLVEECMLAANEAVAKFFQDRELPSVYRFHGEPDEEKLEAFAQLARAYGFQLPPAGEIDSSDLNQFLERMTGHPERRALNQLLLRSMMQAVYSAENVGHYGLGAAQYLHFTSPIRRYPDLLVHRLLKDHWARGGKIPPKAEREKQEAHLEELAAQSSERERAAVSVEREVVSYFQTLLMKDRVGEQFEATVAAITDFGFFVELNDVHVEGLVKGEAFGPDYDLDTATHSLIWPNGRRVRVGDVLQVTLISANVERRQLEFEPSEGAEYEEELPARPRRRAEAAPSRPFRRPGAPQPARGGAQPSRPARREAPGRPERPARRGQPTWREEQRVAPRAPSRREEPKQFERAPRGVEAGRPNPPERREEPELERGGASPHPGFDRLRALAQRGGAGRRGASEERPRGKGGAAGRGAGSRGAAGGRGRASEERRVPGHAELTGGRSERLGGGKTTGYAPVERDKFGNPKRPKGGSGPRKGGGGGEGRSGGAGGRKRR